MIFPATAACCGGKESIQNCHSHKTTVPKKTKILWDYPGSFRWIMGGISSAKVINIPVTGDLFFFRT